MHAFLKNSGLPVMIMGFAVVAVVSETIADSGVDVVEGSLVTVDGLNSTHPPFVKMVLGQKDHKYIGQLHKTAPETPVI